MKDKQRRRIAVSATSRWIIVLLLAAATLAAYWNSFDVPFVFDDLSSVQRNTGVRFGEFSWNLLAVRSVLYLTFTLNYILAAQNVWSYHVVNFLMHVLNGIMIFIVAEHIFRRLEISDNLSRTYAALAAAFFLLHPVQTESVTYISSRSELLSTNFYLLGFLLFVKWPEHRIGFILSVLIAVPFFFGLGSKETVISLPATIFVYDFLFIARSRIRSLFSRWSFYALFIGGGVAAAYFILNVALRTSIGSNLPGHLSSWHYFLTQTRVIVRYIFLVFFPVGLNLDYDFPPSRSILEPAVIASILFLCSILALGWFIRRKHPVFAFSIFWFFLTLAPTSSIVPILDVIFEHRLYMPLVGVCLSFPLLIEAAYKYLKERFAIPASARTYAYIILILFAMGTGFRNHVWRDEVRLWTDVAAKSPKKERPYYSLVWAHYKRGEFDNAIEIAKKGIEQIPAGSVDLKEVSGQMYLQARRLDEGIELMKQVVAEIGTDPGRLSNAYNNLGVAYLHKWNDLQSRKGSMTAERFEAEKSAILSPASEAFSKAVEIREDAIWALDSLVNVSYLLGSHQELESKALGKLASGEDFHSLYTIGKIAFEKGDYTRADEYFERAEKLKTDYKLLFFNHGYALNTLNQPDRAIDKYVQAIRVDPIFAEAHHNVALIYFAKQQLDTAAEHFVEVLRLQPNHVSSNLYLARIYLSQGNRLLAKDHLSTVLKAAPGHQQAMQLWQQVGL